LRLAKEGVHLGGALAYSAGALRDVISVAADWHMPSEAVTAVCSPRVTRNTRWWWNETPWWDVRLRWACTGAVDAR